MKKLNLHKQTIKNLKTNVKAGAGAPDGFSKTCPAVYVQITEDCPPSRKL